MKRYWKPGLALILVVVAIAAVWTCLPQRNLLARSERLVWLHSDTSGLDAYDPKYCWRSARQIMLFSDSNSGFAAETEDLDTKEIHPITALSEWVWQTNPWTKSVSPDGKWMLASYPHAALLAQANGKWAFSGDANATLISLAAWNGHPKVTQAVYNAISPAFWLADSQHWAVFLKTHNGWFIEKHDLREPKVVTLIPIQQAAHPLLNKIIDFPIYGETEAALSGTADNRVFVSRLQQQPDQSLHLALFDLRSPVATVQESFHNLPKGAELKSFALSCDGERIAWLLDFTERQKKYPPFWEPFLSTYITGQSIPDIEPYPTEEIWVSRRDGTDMHELAHRPIVGNTPEIGGLQWTPDSSRISFIYHDYVYSMPAYDFWHR